MVEGNTRQFIENLAKETKVPIENIQKIIIDSFRSSYCQNENKEAELHFEFNKNLEIYRLYKIVEKVNDPQKEVIFNDELIKKAGKKENNIFFCPIETQKLSFFLSKEIQKNLEKYLKDIRQKKEIQEYIALQGSLISGKIQSIEKDYCLINLGKSCHGYWKRNEQPLSEGRKEIYLGQELFFLLKEIREENNLAKIILTRHGSLFLRKVLEKSIPEIKNEIITIHHILCLPNLNNKVIVESKNPQISVMGACIGRSSVRIKSISNIIYPERIDFISQQEGKEKLILRLLPFKVISVLEKESKWEVVVPNVNWISPQDEETIKLIKNFLEKDISVYTLQEKEKKRNRVIIWNGTSNWEEYKKHSR